MVGASPSDSSPGSSGESVAGYSTEEERGDCGPDGGGCVLAEGVVVPGSGEEFTFVGEDETMSNVSGNSAVLFAGGDRVLSSAGKICSRYMTSPVTKIRDICLSHSLEA